ncbi:holo-ACP synthase [Lachnotalea sp. AF33-28]|jgi:holo-[acyl-carrier protein] synthase|uniref:holo-ACP synthase n=1 Tax=Lachnotalea sp. AF33-28 TaxID=2292046 RepID=UPI000E4B5B82|nr:holo-ACP synthase [Lachnotalea sp. AF33-28]RHP31716.1 holo-[acyl-carrier-protein] synthase [Lachnotalea sp. AF33-28]
MVYGIGIDMIEVERVEKACRNGAFFTRFYTEEEQVRFGGRTVQLAGNFAVKEAVAKVFGTGFSGFSPSEIEVLRDERGKPYVKLYGRARKLCTDLGIDRITVSITNTKDCAAAVAIGEKEVER